MSKEITVTVKLDVKADEFRQMVEDVVKKELQDAIKRAAEKMLQPPTDMQIAHNVLGNY